MISSLVYPIRHPFAVLKVDGAPRICLAVGAYPSVVLSQSLISMRGGSVAISIELFISQHVLLSIWLILWAALHREGLRQLRKGHGLLNGYVPVAAKDSR